MVPNTKPVVVDLSIPTDYLGPDKAELRVFVQDVSEQGAPARTIANTSIAARVAPGEHLSVTIDVPVAAIDPKRDYSVRVHVSPSADPSVRSGDLISTQSAPVLTHGHAQSARVMLRAVR